MMGYIRQTYFRLPVKRRCISPFRPAIWGRTMWVLIVDDFLAHGEALNGLVSIVREAGAKLAGAGIIIEKRFQGGGDKLRAQGVHIESLAAIISMEQGNICFA